MRRSALLAPLFHIGLAVLVTWPLVAHPLGRLVGNGDVDVWNHAWGPWWWWSSLSEGALPWRTRLLLWPDGGVLWFIDPVLALLGAPLEPVLGLAGAYNAVVALSVAFSSYAGHRFARALGAEGAAAFVSSAALAASAWVVSEVHNGITEAAGVGFVALALAWVEEAARASTRRAWARAGLGVGMAAIASPYLGLGAGLCALVRGLPSVRVAWAGGLVALAVAAPPALALRAQLGAADAIVKHPDGMNEELALHNAVDPRIFVAPGGFRSVDLSAEGFEHSMYLGLGALALALLGLVPLPTGPSPGGVRGSRCLFVPSGRLVGVRRRWTRGRRHRTFSRRGGQAPPATPRRRSAPGGPERKRAVAWGAAAATVLVFALGPYLFWGDAFVTTAEGARLRLPWWAMQRLAPGLAVAHPLRLATPALAITAAFAAVGAGRLLAGQRAWVAVLVVLADGLVLSGAPWPLPTAGARPPAVYADIARGPGEPVRWGILDLPSDAGPTMATSRYLAWQSAHRRPIPYAPDARASTCSLLRDPPFRALAALSRRRPEEHRRLGLDGTAPGSTDPRRLRERGIRWIVVHRQIDPEAAAAIEAALEDALGPGTEVEDAVRWDLGSR